MNIRTLDVALCRLTIAIGTVIAGECAQAQEINVPEGGWRTIADMARARAYASATLLDNGEVLVTGGRSGDGVNKHCEVFDPGTESWRPVGPTAGPHSGHTATTLAAGRVLVAGGYDGRYIGVAEVYDPASEQWSPAGELRVPRDRHTALRIPDGRVLVAGGFTANGATGVIEAYDATTNTWSTFAEMPETRAYHTAHLIRNDLAAFMLGENEINSASTALYDLVNKEWRHAGDTAIPHAYGQTTTELSGGEIVVIGGEPNTAQRGSLALREAERFDPASEAWRTAAPMSAPRYFHSATLLNDGRILVAGGFTRREQNTVLSSAEVYDPTADAWQSAKPMNAARAGHNAVLLLSGAVLVLGGERQGGRNLNTAEIFD